MTQDVLDGLSPATLRAVARQLREGPGASDAPHFQTVPASHAGALAARLHELEMSLASPDAVAGALDLLAGHKERTEAARPRAEVVWSGPEGQSPRHRTTLAVVQEMFATFQHSLLISTYSIDAGERADGLFGALATRMDQNPSLSVRFFLNLPFPKHGELPGDVISAFKTRFIDLIWPGTRLPEVWYDPRVLKPGARSVLHAKCVVADGREVFVTSANFTEAAHERNVELGLLVRGVEAARSVERPFDALVQGEHALRLL